MAYVRYANRKSGLIRHARHIAKIQGRDMKKRIGILKIMGHDVDLLLTNDQAELIDLNGGPVLGICRCDLCKIILDSELSISQLQSVLFHELCEFVKINTGASYADEHDYFAAYNNVLWGEVNNNKDWLFGNALKKAMKGT